MLSSCTSDETSSDDNPSLPPDCLVVNVRDFIEGEKDDNRQYSYDSQGRLVRIDYHVNNSDNLDIFTYEANRILISSGTYNPVVVELYLDEKGRVVKSSSDVSGYEATYSYNKEGYLIEVHELNWPYSKRTTFSYLAGNLHTVTERASVNGEPERVVRTHVLEYTEERADYNNTFFTPLNSFIFTRHVLGTYFGKASKNLIRKQTATLFDHPSATRTYTYIKDGKDRIATILVQLPNNNTVLEKTITYTCN